MAPKTAPIDPPGYEEPTAAVEGAEPEPAASIVKNNGSKKLTGAAKNGTAVVTGKGAASGVTTAANAPAGPVATPPADANSLVTVGNGYVLAKSLFNLSLTALSVRKGMTDAQFESLGIEIAQVGSCYRFWLGDYILAMVERLRTTDSKITITKVCEYVAGRVAPQYDATSLQNIATTMATVKPDQRVDGLSFTHHEYASKVPMAPSERKKMLIKAKAEGWSTRLFNQKLHERVTGAPASGNDVHVDGVGGEVPKNKKDKGSSGTSTNTSAQGSTDSGSDASETPPSHPSTIKISFEASQAATARTEDFNTTYHRNITVDRYVSNILENLDNLVILSDEGMDALKALKNASAKGDGMTLAEAASRLFVKAARAATPPEPASTSDVARGGPPPVA